jgi:hypothetical protein
MLIEHEKSRQSAKPLPSSSTPLVQEARSPSGPAHAPMPPQSGSWQSTTSSLSLSFSSLQLSEVVLGADGDVDAAPAAEVGAVGEAVVVVVEAVGAGLVGVLAQAAGLGDVAAVGVAAVPLAVVVVVDLVVAGEDGVLGLADGGLGDDLAAQGRLAEAVGVVAVDHAVAVVVEAVGAALIVVFVADDGPLGELVAGRQEDGAEHRGRRGDEATRAAEERAREAQRRHTARAPP